MFDKIKDGDEYEYRIKGLKTSKIRIIELKQLFCDKWPSIYINDTVMFFSFVVAAADDKWELAKFNRYHLG